MTVTIAQRAVELGSNGQVSIGDNPDPQWQGRVHFAPDSATIGPQQFIDVVITVDVPPTINPDLHFVGFLVSPVATGQGQVTVVNQIGSFVTLDVPGPRAALLQATLRMPGFKFGRKATGRLQVANVGQSSVRFWGESDTTSWPGGSTPKQQRFEKSLVPIGAARSMSVSAKAAWPVGFVTIRGNVIYPSTSASATTEIPFSKRVLIIDPRVIAVVAGVLVLAVIRWVVKHRRRRRPLRHSVAR